LGEEGEMTTTMEEEGENGKGKKGK